MKLLAVLAAALPLAAVAQYSPATDVPAQAAPSSDATSAAPPPTTGWAPAPQRNAPPAYPPDAPLRRERTRGSWYIGFGLGGGGGSISDSAGTHGLKDFVGPNPTVLSMNFNVGATISPQLLLGLDVGAVAAISSTETSPGVKDTQIQTTYYDVALTYFPWERGLFVKGGMGLTALTWDLDAGGRSTWRGYDMMAGVGYAWWLGQSFNLTFNLDGSKAWYGSNGPDSTQTFSLHLGCEWY
ncbi:hypothetical protein [Anaeromyxobacter oryzae]|uniref:Outer membrane protein beta-barrel domain-containing protein n=1 Tax=Anaeromyxobacter oryzae TaxID=2918170 RepID=A0ABM7WT21_9BACT|nr:hypothetical protein [Anaeromyxobacter oryzae]BDG02607.1 hypothetical protein AMOR_16030 [Anaeromyxobacter oryzae]